MRLGFATAVGFVLVAFAACQSSPAAEPVEEPPSVEAPETREETLFVGPETVPCTGVAPMDCLQVKRTEDGAWELWYAPIEGFQHEPGYLYELRVLVTGVPNPPADAPDRRYSLLEIVSRTPADTDVAELALEGPTWLLAAQGDPAAPIPVLEGTQITATFADGRVAGTGGCNEYSAGYELDGDTIAIETPIATLMACDEPVMQQEQAYLAALAAVVTHEVAGGQLRLATEDDRVLAYDPQPAGLEDTAWIVTGYNNGRAAVVSPIADTELTASFSEGRVAGSAGCNRYTGSYETSLDTIVIGPAATTRMACPEPEGVMEQESAFLAALASAATWRRDGSRLELRTADDAIAVTMVAARGP